jgi:hypothetical protein
MSKYDILPIKKYSTYFLIQRKRFCLLFKIIKSSC